MRGLGWLRRAGIAPLLCLGLAAPASAAEIRFGDGGWSWFQDPRAITHTGAHTRTYAGYVTPGGDVTVASYDYETEQVASFVLHPALQQDDHVSPALQVRPDGRIAAFYARHSGTPLYYRVTTHPEDVTAWEPPQTIDTNTPGPYGFTYPNPTRLATEGTTYLFWRGGNLDPTFSTQDDGETSWAVARSLMHVPNNQPGPDAERPYVKYASDGQGTIHFAYTNAHPNETPDVNIYYGRIRAGRVEAADGADLSELGTPIAPRDADRVFDGAGPAWIHDVAAGAGGRPVVVFASFPSATSATDHLYHYARWNGSSWDIHAITPAGGSISTGGRSPLYSGGITLDHDDPSTVYLSRQVGQGWWVETWTTPDGGETWTSHILTPASTVKNVRPLSPRGHEPEHETALWMSGAYANYNSLQTTVTSVAEVPLPTAFEPPAPQPPAPTPPPATQPESDVRLARAALSARLVRIGRRGGGRLTVRCRAGADDRCKVAGSLRRQNSRLGTVSGNVPGGERGAVRVRLTRRAAVRLRRSRRLRMRVLATSSSLSGRGAPVRGKVRLVARRRR